jgi:hypothetical protein
MDTADNLRDANPWRAEPDPVKLTILGKLLEELGELTAAASRCVIQGVDAVHPVTEKPNTDWLAEEMIDVESMLVFLRKYVLNLTGAPIDKRMERKRAHIEQWLASF